MQNFVNDFYTINGQFFEPPTTGQHYVNITGYNSIIIVNTGVRRFWITGRSIIIQPFQKLIINGNENELLHGNLYVEFLKGLSLAQALFIRKKFI